MTRRASRGAWIPFLTLLVTAASFAHAGEPKTYRWVGEDGRVYTSTTPPPNGRGVIDAQPATPAKPRAPAAKPAAAMPPSSLRQIPSGNAGSGATPARASAGDGASSCARYQGWVDQWRSATRAVAAAEESLDRLQSDTDRYVRRNDSYYETQIESAEARISRAEERLSQVESDATRAGAPQNCFTE